VEAVDLLGRLGAGALLGDGAMGTLLAATADLPAGCLASTSITRPELVRAAHAAYAAAGAELVETNTFMANRLELSRWGQADMVEAINQAGADLARAAAPGLLVAGAVGPAGSPGERGRVEHHQALDALLEQVVLLDRAGVDVLVLETFVDLTDLCELVEAAKNVSELAVIAEVAFGADGLTLTGEDPDLVAHRLEASGAAAVGANCLAVETVRVVTSQLVRATGLPVSVQPSAGVPVVVRGRPCYLLGPSQFARAAVELVDLGASIVGGCCGTTPDHVRAAATALARHAPASQPGEPGEPSAG